MLVLRTVAVVAFLTLFNFNFAQACDCSSLGDHSATIEQRAQWNKDPRYKAYVKESAVVEVEVLKHHQHGMDVGILQVLVGSESRSQVTVWGDPGHLCRPYTKQFAAGTRWLLFIDKITSDPYTHEAVGDYSISGCGTYFLPVSIVQSQKVIRGAIAPGVTEMPLSLYQQWHGEILKNVDELANKIQVASDQWELSCWAQVALSGPTIYTVLASEKQSPKFKLTKDNPMSKIVLQVDPQTIFGNPDIPQSVAQEITQYPITMELELNYSAGYTDNWIVDPLRHLNFILGSQMNDAVFKSTHLMTLNLFDQNLGYKWGAAVRELKTPDYKVEFSFGLK